MLFTYPLALIFFSFVKAQTVLTKTSASLQLAIDDSTILVKNVLQISIIEIMSRQATNEQRHDVSVCVE